MRISIDAIALEEMRQVISKLHVLWQTVFVLSAWASGSTLLAGGQTNWHGYLIDRQCAESVREDSKEKTFVMHHTKDCALMPNCRAKGYALFVDGKWYELDKRGNELAVRTLTATKKKSGFYVQITGAAQGRLLKVQSMKEVDEPKHKNGSEKRAHGTQ